MNCKQSSVRWAKAICLLCTLFMFFAVHCNFSVPESTENSILVRLFSRIIASFSSYGLADIFILITLYLVAWYIWQNDWKIDGWSAGLSAVFSVCYIISSSFYNSLNFITASHYQVLLSGLCFVGYTLLIYCLLRLLLIYTDRHTPFSSVMAHVGFLHRHFLLCNFLLIFACWLPWILLAYPGSLCPDATWQLQQFFGDSTFTTHHPPLSTWIMGTLFTIGEAICNANFGLFLYTLLQTCLGAWIFSLGIKQLYTAGLRLRYCLIITLFFALTTIWGCHAQWYEKDLLFTEISALFLIYLIDVVIKKSCNKRDAAKLILTGLLASLLRNNGIYAVVPTLLVLAICMAKPWKKAAWLSFVSVMAFYIFITSFLYPSVFGIQSGSVAEALSIPFQQTARYVSRYGDEVTEDERAAIDGVLDYSTLAEVYNPIISDPVKNGYKGDNSKLPAYFKVWLQMFLKHPGSYIIAVWNNSYGYLAPVGTNMEPDPSNSDFENNYPYVWSLGVHRASASLSDLLSYIKQLGLNLPAVKYLCMPGTYTWLLLVCIMVLLKQKIYSPLIVFIPELMNLLVCIASPLSNAVRYEMPTIAAVPFLLGWTYCLSARKKAHLETTALPDRLKTDM